MNTNLKAEELIAKLANESNFIKFAFNFKPLRRMLHLRILGGEIILKLRAFLRERDAKRKLQSIRKKSKINIVFVVHEVAMWKTETLYVAMLSDPRFNPIICPAISNEEIPTTAIPKFQNLLSYLKRKGYKYQEITNINKLCPDITFYSKVYDEVFSLSMGREYNNGVVDTVGYGFNILHNGILNRRMVNESAQFFVENESVAKFVRLQLNNKGRNLYVTGVPQTDLLMLPVQNFEDLWKIQLVDKKRIIWAPHFTIHSDLSCLNLSSFLTLYDVMLDFAKKYENKVQFAFKPHPILYQTLIKEWGKKRTDEYYDTWRNLPNSQIDEGEYVPLFKYSDAMIHDCNSFLIEYLYIDRPVLYTLRDTNMYNQYNDFGKGAYDCVLHGHTPEEVESFILSVIEGKDEMKEKRHAFFDQYLLPPNGKTASENIIDAIWGQNGYK